MKINLLTNPHGLILATILLIALTLACSEQEAPFAVGDRATAAPTPTDVELVQAAAAATPTSTPVPLPTSVLPSISTPPPTVVPPAPKPSPTSAPTPPSDQGTQPTTEAPSHTPMPEPTAPSEPPTPTPEPFVPPTHTPVPLPADYDRNASGPPRDELIKIAQWDDSRVKLGNFVAGYIVAHGLDHPVRVIDTDPDDYKEALPHSDIDVVLEAVPEWAQPYVDAGVLVLLGPLSSANPDTVVAVNASVWQRAPEVGKFFEDYEWDGDALDKLAARITGGRLGLKASVTGLIFFKDNEDLWTQWVDQTAVENVRAAVEKGNNSLCREWVLRRLAETFRQCLDDPGKVVHLG